MAWNAIIPFVFRLFSSISDLFLARSLIFHFLSHERERDSICSVLANVRHRYPLNSPFYLFLPCPRSDVRIPREEIGRKRARNRRHWAIMPGIQIADDSTKNQNGIRWAAQRSMNDHPPRVSVCSLRDGQEGARVHRAWTSASPVIRRPGRLKIFNFRLTKGSPTKRPSLLRMHWDATSDSRNDRVLCRRSRLTYSRGFRKKWNDWFQPVPVEIEKREKFLILLDAFKVRFVKWSFREKSFTTEKLMSLSLLDHYQIIYSR